MKSNEIELFKESWHNVYPNKKRKRIKNEGSKRYLYYQLLDKLLELGFENKVYLMSSMFVDLIIKCSSLYYGKGDTIYINFLPEEQCFILKENIFEENKTIEYGKLALKDTIEKIVTITNKWC